VDRSPAGGLAVGDPQQVRQQRPGGPGVQPVGQLPPVTVGHHPMIHQRRTVTDPFELHHKPQQPGDVVVVQPTILNRLHQMAHRHPQLVQRMVHRRRVHAAR
jgi:hypothetical protein